jgi:hypothetical protein
MGQIGRERPHFFGFQPPKKFVGSLPPTRSREANVSGSRDDLGETLGKVVKLESKNQAPAAPCTHLQSGLRRQAGKDSPLTPELKEFIDRAIVTILVKEYLAVTVAENDLADEVLIAAHSLEQHGRTWARNVRP